MGLSVPHGLFASVLRYYFTNDKNQNKQDTLCHNSTYSINNNSPNENINNITIILQLLTSYISIVTILVSSHTLMQSGINNNYH